jgi:hypothetical protein
MVRLITLEYWGFLILFYIGSTAWYIFGRFLIYTYEFIGVLMSIGLGIGLFEVIRSHLPKLSILEKILMISFAALGYKTGSDFLEHALVTLVTASENE